MANELLYGFYKGLRDSINLPVVDVEPRLVSQAVQETLAQHRADLEAMMDIFVDPTTDYSIRYETAALTRNQPLDAVGRAIANRGAGYYDVAFPIRRSGNAWGYDWEALQYMTVKQINNRMSEMLTGDIRWNRDHLLAAIFTPTSYTFKDERRGDLTIQPLANNDSVTYLKTSASEEGATDTHYLFLNDDIDDTANPLITIKAELTEHPENGDTVVVFVADDLVSDIEALAGFVTKEDTDIDQGSSSDRLVGSLGIAVPGTIMGKANGCWLVNWSRIPSGYLLGVTVGGSAKPIWMREPELPQLRGFREYAERQDWPWFEKQLRRYAGYGAYNRVGAVVMKVGAASYTAPTGYTAPLKN